jgi:hypothetical protein
VGLSVEVGAEGWQQTEKRMPISFPVCGPYWRPLPRKTGMHTHTTSHHSLRARTTQYHIHHSQHTSHTTHIRALGTQHEPLDTISQGAEPQGTVILGGAVILGTSSSSGFI